MLYQLGSIVFEVAPLNVDQVERSAGADFAEKPIMGRAPAFEFMGEAAQEETFQGKIFPEAVGGLDEMEALHQVRASGAAQFLMRGDGKVIGWRNIVSVRETDRYLAADGVGRVIEFEMQLRRADKPASGNYQGPQLGLIP